MRGPRCSPPTAPAAPSLLHLPRFGHRRIFRRRPTKSGASSRPPGGDAGAPQEHRSPRARPGAPLTILLGSAPPDEAANRKSSSLSRKSGGFYRKSGRTYFPSATAPPQGQKSAKRVSLAITSGPFASEQGFPPFLLCEERGRGVGGHEVCHWGDAPQRYHLPQGRWWHVGTE